MPYKKYGETFHKLRKQKQVPLVYFEEIGISKTALSKFERGETMLGFDRLSFALQAIDITLEEFEHHLNNFSLSIIESISDDIFDLSIRADDQSLLELSKELEESNYKIFSLLSQLARRQTDCSVEELANKLDEVRDFLYAVNIWGYYELCVLFHSVFYLEIDEIVFFNDLCLNKQRKLFNIPHYRTKLLDLIYRSINLLVQKGEEEWSSYLLEKIAKYQVPHTMANQNFKNLTLGYWEYRFGNHQIGLKQMQEAIGVIEDIETDAMANYIVNAYNFLVRENGKRATNG